MTRRSRPPRGASGASVSAQLPAGPLRPPGPGEPLGPAGPIAPAGPRRRPPAPRGPRRPSPALSRRLLWAAACAGLCAALLPLPAAGQAPAAPSQGVLDDLVGSYASVASSWLDRIIPLAERTFSLLAVLEFAVSGLWWAFGREGLDAVFAALLRRFVLLSFLYSLLSLFPFWIPAILRGFEVAGQSASGAVAVNPSQVLDLGITLASHILTSFGALALLTDPVGNLLAALTALLVFLCFLGVAAQLVLTLVESYVVLSGGCLFLAFAAFRPTASFADNYLAYAVYVGTKIYLLYLLVAVGLGLAQQWAVLDLSSSGEAVPSLILHFQVLAGAAIFCLLVWKIPGGVASRLTQGSGFHLRDAFGSR